MSCYKAALLSNNSIIRIISIPSIYLLLALLLKGGLTVFPIIESIDDVLPALQGRKEFALQVKDGLTNIFYLIQDTDTFDDPIRRECRGLTFNQDGKLISRPLHKFYNLYENKCSQFNALPWSKNTVVMSKLDGSMGATFILGGKVGLKTKGGHHSRQSIEMTAYIHARPNYLLFVEHVIECGLTACFEFIAPHERIVVSHGDEVSLTLLHIRDNLTGQYIDPYEYAEYFNIPLVQRSEVNPSTLKEFLTEISQKKKEEGVVFQFPDTGEMIKVKTDWYLQLHKLVSFRRERDFAKLVISGNLDDVKAMLASEKFDITGLEIVERKVNKIFSELKSKVENTAAEIVKLDISDHEAYKRYGKLPYYKFIRYVIDGNEPDYLKYFIRYYLKKEFSLDEIL